MEKQPPTREDLAGVLDDIFQRILREGEDARIKRGDEPPDWIPMPQEDPLYEGLEPEEWHTVPTEPERRLREWREAVLLGRTDDVRPLVAEAIERSGLIVLDSTEAWWRLSRLALVVAAKAHGIDVRREFGDYSDGWPQSAGISATELPGPSRSDGAGLDSLGHPAADAAPQPTPVAAAPATQVPTFSESYNEFMRKQVQWTYGYRNQAELALRKFLSLVSDMPVTQVTNSVAEQFRLRAPEVPSGHGKGVYAAKTPAEARAFAEALRAKLKRKGDVIQHGGRSFTREEALELAKPMTMKTVDRDFTFLRQWGRWMLDNDHRKPLLVSQANPFAGQSFRKSHIEAEYRRGGRQRLPFEREELVAMLNHPLFTSPPPMLQTNDAEVQLAQTRFWSILIALYAGLRLGEIAQLRSSDFKVSKGINYIALSAEGDRTLKTEAATRMVPLHPELVRLGLPEFAASAGSKQSTQLFNAMTYSVSTRQHGANISKWFDRWCDEVGITSTQKTFHSLRHNFVSAMASVTDENSILLKRLVGHKDGTTTARYFTHHDIARMFASISRLDHDLDLSLIFLALKAGRGVARAPVTRAGATR